MLCGQLVQLRLREVAQHPRAPPAVQRPSSPRVLPTLQTSRGRSAATPKFTPDTIGSCAAHAVSQAPSCVRPRARLVGCIWRADGATVLRRRDGSTRRGGGRSGAGGHARRDRGVPVRRRRRRRLQAAPHAQPLRRRRGRHQRGARQRRRGQPREPHLLHRQGLRLPRRPGRDRGHVRRGPGRHLRARAHGRRSSRAPRTAASPSARSAPAARRAPATPPTSPATCCCTCSTSSWSRAA